MCTLRLSLDDLNIQTQRLKYSNAEAHSIAVLTSHSIRLVFKLSSSFSYALRYICLELGGGSFDNKSTYFVIYCLKLNWIKIINSYVNYGQLYNR